MANTIRVEIVSAEEELWAGDVTEVIAPAEHGEIGILPRHAPLMATLLPGDIRVHTEDGGEELFYVSGGIIEVQPHIVTVLSDTAVRGEDLDEEAALAAQQRAEEAIKDRGSDMDYAKARAELAQAAAQLRAIQRMRRVR